MSHSDKRTIIVGDVGTKPVATKQPNDAFGYVFDYTAWLGSDTTIVSAVVSVDPLGASAPTLGVAVVTTTTVTIPVSGGLKGYRGDITCLATLADGEEKEAEFEINIVEVGYVAPPT